MNIKRLLVIILGKNCHKRWMQEQRFMGNVVPATINISFRVDSVHNETFKVLGGLNRTELNEGKK
jgi:hypothetical protein